MNERIRQLAEQAGGNPNYKAFRGYFLPPPPDYIDPATVDLEKFAQLIVRECADHCDLLLDHKISSEWSRGTHDCSRAIKKHFGVEECKKL
jgi:hypothetical protein